MHISGPEADQGRCSLEHRTGRRNCPESSTKTTLTHLRETRLWMSGRMVPRAGIEPALLSEPDFESGASTNSANGARKVWNGLYHGRALLRK
ncbi:protein of unknown function [Pseudorhizobium banfieldiae]|uniref:Uncharacterized protein n=1 Tax=Pseudorhizobium banfieldiae TaxID=1125847 RepID=L0NJ70_9HYPH|nr:protein of unknown function [Pseudorhizobium banfieldiae]